MSLKASGNEVIGIPDGLAITREFTFGGVMARNNNYISARPQNGYTPGQFFTLEMPLEMLDFRSSTLQFTITGTPAGGATFTRFNKDIRSIFKRIVVRFGSKQVLDVQNNGLLYNILDGNLDVNWESTVGALTTGTGPAAQRNADFLNPNKVYAVQLYNNEDSFFYNVYPFQKLGVQCYIDVYLAPANEVIETDVSGATYVVNNVQWHTASLVPSKDWEIKYGLRLPLGITFTYLTYENLYDSSVLQAGVSQASKTLSYKYSSLLGVFCVFQTSSTLQSQTTLNKLSTYNFLGLNSANLKIGSQCYPIDTNRSASDLLTMYAELFGLSMRFPFAQAVNFDSTNFVLCIPLARHIKENRDIGASLDGLNTSIGTSITLDMGFSAPLPSAQTMNIYGLVENTITFNPNGSITWNS